MADKPNSIQAQLVDARRQQILDAATEVFADKGFHGATIRQIAQRAGIADGTIYIYFKTKTDLLIGILDRLNESDQRAEALTPGEEIDFSNFFVTYMRHRLQLLDANFQTFQAILPDILSNPTLRDRYYSQVVAPTFAIAEPIFQGLIDQGVLKPHNPALVLRAISSMALGLLVTRMIGDPVIEAQWEQFPELIGALILPGLTQ